VGFPTVPEGKSSIISR